jgi:hypothetical protein
MQETDTSNATPEYVGDLFAQEDLEGFVDSTRAAEFLCVSRRHLLEMARRGLPGAYSFGTGDERRNWIFLLSELAAAVTMQSAVPAERKV